MKVLKDGAAAGKAARTVLTLGNFDGLHLGHRKILDKVVKRASKLGVPSVVYTFDPHPLKVVAPEKSPPMLLDMADKKALIGALGVDYLALARFTREFASRHPREFVEEELVKKFHVVEVWVGHDFSFGKGKTGTVEYLEQLGGEFGFAVHIIPAYKKGGAIVSSSRIRSLIREGRAGTAAGLLGRRYSIKGKVVRGTDIGKRLGFPTANLKVTSELVPKNGVYAAFASVGGRQHPAVLNIGTAPTFGGKKTAVEVHIMDFSGDIYGRPMTVHFVRRLRGEKTFGSKDALIRQIQKDKERAERILEAALTNG